MPDVTQEAATEVLPTFRAHRQLILDTLKHV